MIPSEKNSLEKLGELFGLLLAAVAATAIRGWLLSVCASFLAPSFSLTFWEWCLIAVTVRSVVSSSPADQ